MFERVFVNNPEGRTKILVTHALHFLPQVDYICTIADGQIMERGTYAELMANRGVFSKFVQQFGSKQQEEKEETEEIASEAEVEREGKVDGDPNTVGVLEERYEKGKTIMQEEERNVGAITWKVYKTYLAAGNGYILIPCLLLSLLLLQGAQVMSSYWLVFWQEQRFNQPAGFYVCDFVSSFPRAAHPNIFHQMGIYATLGVSLTIMYFVTGGIVGPFAYFTSKSLHLRTITSVMHAPMSFFETTPLGRIMNRFSKDIDTIDNTASDSLRMFLLSTANVSGGFVLVSIVIPWFLVAVGVTMGVYYALALYYRASARELKRLDATLRSSLYAHFSESLTGLATIRAYGETERFRKESEDRMNIENRFVSTLAGLCMKY